MTLNLLVSVRSGHALAQILEGVTVEELLELKVFGILPFQISLYLINHNGFLMIARNLESMLVALATPEILESSLVDHPADNFLVLCVDSALSPAF